MKSTTIFGTALIALGTFYMWNGAAWSQNPPAAAPRTGPGVQASADSKEADVLKTCKTPAPAARGGGAPRGGGGGGGAKDGKAPQGKGQAKGAAPAQTFPRDYTVAAIPGVIAAGEKWKEVWTVEGNNADGIFGTKDGGLLIAQNDNSKIMKMDKKGKVTVAYEGLNTSGSVAMNTKGALFVVNRGLNPTVGELLPTRKTFADKLPNGDPLDCIRVVMNDITADSKGGVYFTMGTVYHADASGKVTGYGQGLNTNGIMLSLDEKHLYVTNGATLVAFDVQPDGSLTNQHDFATMTAGGGDGSTFDSAGRMYVTFQGGVEVISPDGKILGAIPTPRGVISVTISGADHKTLYAVARTGDTDWILSIPLMAQAPKGRGK